MNEELKTTQEVAKAIQKSSELAMKVGEFIALVIRGSLEQGIGIFEDKLKYVR